MSILLQFTPWLCIFRLQNNDDCHFKTRHEKENLRFGMTEGREGEIVCLERDNTDLFEVHGTHREDLKRLWTWGSVYANLHGSQLLSVYLPTQAFQAQVPSTQEFDCQSRLFFRGLSIMEKWTTGRSTVILEPTISFCSRMYRLCRSQFSWIRKLISPSPLRAKMLPKWYIAIKQWNLYTG